MTWRLIGSSGLFAGSRLKKCGVTASASLSPDSKTPLRSSSLSPRCFSSCARVVTLFLSCHFQSFQSSGTVSDQYPGACETKSFPSPFSEAKVFIFVVDEKVKTLKYRVNAGTWPCATHVDERFGKGDVPAPSTTRSTADVFLGQHSLPPATRMSPVHVSRVTTTRLAPRRRRLLGARLAAGGPSLQRSSAIMCEDNSRFHSNCVWVDRPCEEQAWVLLGCTVDRPVQETRANFENIVRV